MFQIIIIIHLNLRLRPFAIISCIIKTSQCKQANLGGDQSKYFTQYCTPNNKSNLLLTAGA